MESKNDNQIIFEENVVLYKNFPLLDEMRREGKFCDVTIKVKELSLRAHKVVLSATIPYFHGMFTSNMLESKMSEVTLIEPETLEALINFSYTGKIVLDTKTVQSLMFGASYFQLTNLLQVCEDFLYKRLNPHEVLGIRKFARKLSCKLLVNECQKFIEEHFDDVSRCDEYLDETFEELEQLLSNNHLNVHKEELVYEALMRWIKKDLESREKLLPQLLTKIKLPLISPEYLVNNIGKEELIKSSHACRNLIDDAKNYHLLPKKDVIETFKTEPRRCESLSGFIFVLGGLDKNSEKTVESYNPLVANWSLTAPMKMCRSKVAVAVMKNDLFVIGGEFNSQAQSTVQCFNFDSISWFQHSCLQKCRSAGGAAALNNKVYVCGGFDGTCSLSSVEYYDFKSGRWIYTQSMISKRSSCAVVALNGYLYALGGHDDQTVLDLVERYNPKTEKWTKVSPMLTKRCRLGAASLDGKLYACGGFDGSSFLQTAEVYDPKDDTWQTIAPMNKKRSRVAVTVNMGKLWAIGGYDGKYALSSVEIYNPSLDEWTYGPPMTASAGGLGVGVINCF